MEIFAVDNCAHRFTIPVKGAIEKKWPNFILISSSNGGEALPLVQDLLTAAGKSGVDLIIINRYKEYLTSLSAVENALPLLNENGRLCCIVDEWKDGHGFAKVWEGCRSLDLFEETDVKREVNARIIIAKKNVK